MTVASSAQAVTVANNLRHRQAQGFILRQVPARMTRYAFYAFIFSIPFERLDVGIESFTIPKLMGMVLVALAMLRTDVCFKFPRSGGLPGTCFSMEYRVSN